MKASSTCKPKYLDEGIKHMNPNILMMAIAFNKNIEKQISSWLSRKLFILYSGIKHGQLSKAQKNKVCYGTTVFINFHVLNTAYLHLP